MPPASTACDSTSRVSSIQEQPAGGVWMPATVSDETSFLMCIPHAGLRKITWAVLAHASQCWAKPVISVGWGRGCQAYGFPFDLRDSVGCNVWESISRLEVLRGLCFLCSVEAATLQLPMVGGLCLPTSSSYPETANAGRACWGYGV